MRFLNRIMANTFILTAVLVILFSNYGTHARRFRNARTSKCLDGGMNGAIYTKTCYPLPGSYQEWDWANSTYFMKNSKTLYCLEANLNNVVYGRECDGNIHQQWVATDNLEFINSATGSCLDSNDKEIVYTMGCNHGPYQLWLT